MYFLIGTNGEIEVSMERCGKNLYKVKFDAINLILDPLEQFPEIDPIEIQLLYNSGVPWSHFDDYSFIHHNNEDELLDNDRVVVWDKYSKIISGVVPDSIDIVNSSYSFCLMSSKERTDWQNPGGNTTSEPSLRLKNVGNYLVKNAHLYYYFSADVYPNIIPDIQDHADKATVHIETLDSNYYAVHISFENIDLYPGDSIEGINFELSNTDLSPWDYKDDPSFLGSDTLINNINILVLDENANRLGGMNLDEIKGQLSFAPEALELSSDSAVSSPKIRLFNGGIRSIESFKVYYYFTTENGKDPICDVIDAPGCLISVEHIQDDQYRIVYECTGVHVQPGGYFPNSGGMIVELHYNDMSDWDRSNDYSAEEIENTWSTGYKIVIEDMDGKLIWGEYP